MILIDGKKIRKIIKEDLIKRISLLSYKPTLLIIQVGDRPESTLYINNKIKFGASLGIDIKYDKLDESIKEEDLLDVIYKANSNDSIKGIIIQLPLPKHLNKDRILNSLDISKDVDGLSETNQILFYSDSEKAVIPATARGVLRMIDEYNFNLKGMNVAIMGRSNLVGKPIAYLLSKRGAKVSVCHRGTIDIPSVTSKSDLLIVATGVPNLVKENYVKDGQIIIDVGITSVGDGKYVGDVDFENVKDKVSMISPVPGGVGAVTVVEIFENFLDLAEKSS